VRDTVIPLYREVLCAVLVVISLIEEKKKNPLPPAPFIAVSHRLLVLGEKFAPFYTDELKRMTVDFKETLAEISSGKPIPLTQFHEFNLNVLLDALQGKVNIPADKLSEDCRHYFEAMDRQQKPEAAAILESSRRVVATAFLSFGERYLASTLKSPVDLLSSSFRHGLMVDLLFCAGRALVVLGHKVDEYQVIYVAAVKACCDAAIGRCAACTTPSKLKCSKCSEARFCNAECQRKVWRFHKMFCGRVTFETMKHKLLERPPWEEEPPTRPLSSSSTSPAPSSKQIEEDSNH